jgi:hypothetical protein
MHLARPLIIAILAATASHPVHAERPPTGDAASIERGRYLVKIGGCNDCHTPGYTQANGKVPESQWLTGDQLGWRGPWGTTYSSNLRRVFARLTEAEWLKQATTAQFRPPMPWFTLHEMTKPDLRAIYRFAKSLGPAGNAAPAYVPPDQEPKGPYVQFPMPPI